MGRILAISIFEGKYLLQFKQNSGYNDALFTILTDGWMDVLFCIIRCGEWILITILSFENHTN